MGLTLKRPGRPTYNPRPCPTPRLRTYWLPLNSSRKYLRDSQLDITRSPLPFQSRPFSVLSQDAASALYTLTKTHDLFVKMISKLIALPLFIAAGVVAHPTVVRRANIPLLSQWSGSGLEVRR
jgi:hypothetical protein